MDIGIHQIMSSMVELFGVVYTSGLMLLDFFTTPINQNAPGFETFLGDFASLTPFEFMFGPALILILVIGFVKFITLDIL